MFGQNYYFGTTRKYIVVFGTLFNDIVITRDDAAGNVVQSIKVPLTYGPKEKMLARALQDPNLDREMAITLPRMSFVYHGYKYDGQRKLNTLHGIAKKDTTNPNKFKWQYEPVAVNLDFSLYIYVNNAEDGTKIVEQIQPNFRPDWTVKVNLVPEMDQTYAIPIVLNDCRNEYQYEGDLKQRSVLMWTLDFTLKGYLFGPIKKRPVIKFANTQFKVGTPEDNSGDISIVRVTPGMYANGDPTANAAASISPLLIEVDDVWTYAIQTSGLILTEE